jgi:hypothetical protein
MINKMGYFIITLFTSVVFGIVGFWLGRTYELTNKLLQDRS